MVGIIDFGSQYTQLIARRVRELKIYCEIFPYTSTYKELEKKGVKAVILSGGPNHISDKECLKFDRNIIDKLPSLGICYGMQIIAHLYGGKVVCTNKREYGETLFRPGDDILFEGIEKETVVWMSHLDCVTTTPPGFEAIGKTASAEIAAMKKSNSMIYGLQFHPEVLHTKNGLLYLKNFLTVIAGIKQDWTPGSMLKRAEEYIRNTVKDEKTICALSGGVDSSCLAAILNEVSGKKSLCVFVNTGLLRKDEEIKIQKVFKTRVNLKYIDASEMFLQKLKNVADPEKKRKIIGRTFIKIFEKEAEQFGAKFLAQGTLYPDVIESISPFGGPSARIKSHHNVGGLPKRLKLSLVEPFKFLFKDEVRLIGHEMGLPSTIINRQPFPGPGLAVRIIGSVNRERTAVLKNADAIINEEIRAAGLYEKIWQSFAILLPVQSVGVMGDKRTYEHVITVRAVTSADGMTADWVKLPYELLARISNRIVNEVHGINRVVYDITSKPPGTIEWE